MIIWRQRIARGLLFGAFASAVQACDFIQGARETRSLNRIGPAEEAAYAAFRSARQPEASKALLELATILQREETDWSGTSHGKVIAFDLCLTYGRLGLLAVGRSRRSCTLSRRAHGVTSRGRLQFATPLDFGTPRARRQIRSRKQPEAP